MRMQVRFNQDAINSESNLSKLTERWGKIDLFLGDLVIDDKGEKTKNYYHITNRNGKKFFMCSDYHLETLEGKQL